jgi:hypothetical protein
MAEDWAKKAAERLQAEEKSASQKAERSSQLFKLKQTEGPKLWSELCQWLQEQIKQMNDNLGHEVLVAPLTSNEKLDIFRNRDSGKPLELHIAFDPDAGVLHYKTYNTDAHIQTAVTEKNEVVFMGSHGLLVDVATVGSMMLNNLMGWKD